MSGNSSSYFFSILLADDPSQKNADDLRSEFERDYGRAVFSTPFRRLQDKAQVFPLEALDGIRTRLTHSVEVSTVARDLACQLFGSLAEKEVINHEQAAQLTTIAATCGLLHDVGNPPFGHAGELAIRDWFATKQKVKLLSTLHSGARDFTEFDGNAQTIRLITKLQVLADQYGLNLTCGTLSAATKYLATGAKVAETPHQMSKVGVFESEEPLVLKVRAEVGLAGTARHPVTFVVEAADDIVYSVVDLEDGIKKRVITWEQLREELDHNLGATSCLWSTLKRKVAKQLGCETPCGHIDGDAFGQAFRIQAIGLVIPQVRTAFETRLREIQDGTYGQELVADDACEAKAFVKACKKIGGQFVYASKDVLRLELMGRRIIHDLMDVFWEGAKIGQPDMKTRKYAGKSYRLISANYRNVFEAELKDPEGKNENYNRLQLVVDYVAGMTDTFALDLHKQLQNG